MVHATIARFILKRVAKAVAKRGAERIIEEVTGFDVPDAPDLIRAIEDAINRRGASPPEDAVEMAVEQGELPPRAIEVAEEHIMTDFNDFMSIGLNQCVPSDASQDVRQAQFAALVDVWNREKEEIKAMSQAEVRRNLECP